MQGQGGSNEKIRVFFSTIKVFQALKSKQGSETQKMFENCNEVMTASGLSQTQFPVPDLFLEYLFPV